MPTASQSQRKLKTKAAEGWHSGAYMPLWRGLKKKAWSLRGWASPPRSGVVAQNGILGSTPKDCAKFARLSGYSRECGKDFPNWKEDGHELKASADNRNVVVEAAGFRSKQRCTPGRLDRAIRKRALSRLVL